MKKVVVLLFIVFTGFYTIAQTPEQRRRAESDSLWRQKVLDSVVVMPEALDINSWLLLNENIKNELSGAVDNLYNFKFDRAERQFRSLRRRYPEHPMAYFLMGLSQWWKILPTNIQTKQYDDAFFAYMDTTITYSEKLMRQNQKNYEGAFFLAAAHGFAARLHAERSNWRKATVHSKRALNFLEKSREANGLSPEFLFGDALYNYYSVWIAEHYPMLRPVIFFFPNGNKPMGLNQLRHVANHGFYTGVEAKYWLMKIYSDDPTNTMESYFISRHLALKYPDNAYFQRFYARQAFVTGHMGETEQVSLAILNKLSQRMPGYESISGRYASYFLGYLANSRKDLAKAKQYFNQCIAFANQTGENKSGYAIHSYLYLARIADK